MGFLRVTSPLWGFPQIDLRIRINKSKKGGKGAGVVSTDVCLNIKTILNTGNKGKNRMDLSAYFQALEYVLMTSTFIALILIFLYMFHGREDEETTEKA